MEVYLDNSATTRVFPEVAELMRKIMCEDYGNPSSLHRKGVEAEHYLRYAQETMARLLKVQDKEIFFTSGGTESDNMALIGGASANNRRGRHIITTQVEHPAILQTCKYLEAQGYGITYLPVNAYGQISLDDLQRAIGPDTILVSIMHTNNEMGALQPIAEAGALIKRLNPGTLFHVDAVQGFGKARIYPRKMGIDLMSISGHKIHGPKGIGVLYVGDKVKIHPLLHGGGQQKNMRSGTDNVPGAAGMARAAELLYQHYEGDRERLYGCKKKFLDGIRKMESIQINGLLPGKPDGEGTASHIVSVSVAGVRSEVMLHALEEEGIYVSAGSACSSNKPSVSQTLQAIGLEKGLLGSTLRFSLSFETTEEEIAYCLEGLKEVLPMLRKYVRR